ncbi:MAG: hypothetical protein LBJ60_05020 [Tannerellaceae bacterium]|jgi:hypothetical protein|nr:hypothetical protein [Tannerellaceae bacterium]
MSKVKKESFFWTSYSDLMTSLFFVMLVLFVLTIVILNKRMVQLNEQKDQVARAERIAQEQIDKIKEIEQATKDIDPTYFIYNETYKKHILNIPVNFPRGISTIHSIDLPTRQKLIEAGKAIQRLIHEKTKEYGIQYLLVIEGQASKDTYAKNYELSYERALNLRAFWNKEGLDFGRNCEVLISGTGVGGVMREPEEEKNQRFLIHIIPKPGVIEAGKKSEPG